MILKARERQKKDPPNFIRELDTSRNLINFSAKTLLELISWDDIREPSLTVDISTETLQEYAKSSNPLPLIFPFPCHTQGTERYIPLVSSTADKVCESEQEGYILNTIHARETNPTFKNKSVYKIPSFFK
jgi:hypothetical protein